MVTLQPKMVSVIMLRSSNDNLSLVVAWLAAASWLQPVEMSPGEPREENTMKPSSLQSRSWPAFHVYLCCSMMPDDSWIAEHSISVFLNLGDFKMCGLHLPELLSQHALHK